MTAGVEGVVTEVLRKHSMYLVGGVCIASPACKWEGHAGEYAAHQAAAVVQALGLTEEVSTASAFETTVERGGEGAFSYGGQTSRYIGQRTRRRWVSPWVAVERGEP